MCGHDAPSSVKGNAKGQVGSVLRYESRILH